jgi:alpha-2-macroglobulin
LSLKTTLITFLAGLMLATAGAVPPQGGGNPFESLKAEAERQYAEKSFQRAHDVYEEAAKLTLSPDERRWVEMRLADTAWRAAGDDTDRNKARVELEKLVRDGAHDRVWAEAMESIGDATKQQGYYVQALDWWAGQDDLALARRRYLDMVWKLAGDNDRPWNVPREVLVNVLKIAEAPEDRAHAQYLLAQQLTQEGNPASIERAIELTEEIMAAGKKSAWYDDALFLAGSSYARYGDYDDDSATGQPNYGKALELLRRLLAELKPEETKYSDEAQRLINEITKPSVNVQVAGTFLPEVEQKAALSWRNVGKIELTLFAVDLTKDAAFDQNGRWIDRIRTEGREVVRRWTYDTNDKGQHYPGSAEIPLTPRLATGAYVLTALGAKEESSALVLVTDAHILVHSGGSNMQVFVSHVLTGEPIANARVRVLYQQGKVRKESTAQTNANGLAALSVKENGSVLITAAAGARQAYHQTWTYDYGATTAQGWRVYAFTDRPAYRPGETVQWKIFARTRVDERWSTPSGQTLTYQINSPRGEKVATGTAKLTDFGSFWAELPLTPAMPLGAYTISFVDGKTYVGAAQLFRLEEYKLPEFVVHVTTPDDKLYRLGDTIEATVEAEYYFGGPVANADVTVLVHQAPFQRYWTPWREYDWYWRGWIAPPQESVTRTEQLHTDAAGRAVLRIATPRDATDTQYRIEARVVDASRREVRGEGTVRVTRQRYSVMASPEHYLHRPGESASVKFKAMDANDKPVQTTGTVKIVQRRWRPDVIRGGRYADDDVTTSKLTTDAAGEATMTFTPKTPGYYVVRWTSVDGNPSRAQDIVAAETTIWVADKGTIDIGYHADAGIELLIDKETVRVGQTASALLVTPSSGRWVLLSTFGDDALDAQVVKLDGTVKLVQIPIDDRHVPDFFITASSIFDRQLATDTQRVVVPPVEHFLTVEVKPDRAQYEPRQDGTLTVTTRDASGKPVPAEVAVSLSDEAVTAIQEDTSGDPRQFFYGDVRQQRLQVSAGVQSQQYITREDEEEEKKRRRDAMSGNEYLVDGVEQGVAGGVMGGVVGGVAGGVPGGRYAEAETFQSITMNAPVMAPPPPPKPMLAKDALEADAAAPVQVRSDFRSTALWKPDVVTDANGTATVKVHYPEALTTWRATARAATAGSDFGMATSTSRTNLPLIVRLQAPRFFVTGDQATVSAVINNNTDAAMTVTPSLDVEGLTLGDKGSDGMHGVVNVPARGEARADWTVVAEKAGNARLRVAGRSSEHSDAMEKSFVVYEHGIDKLIARSGKLRGDEAIVRLELPRERQATDLTVQVAPSLAVAMLDALPYLIEYPYGCTEQTMSRFLPAAIVARTLEKLGLGRARVAGKDLDDVTAKGLARLYDMQHDDGGWGWWKEGDSDDFMTAYVVWGFSIARDGGLKVNESAVDRAVQWLQERLVKNENQWSDQAWMLHAMSAWRAKPSDAERRAYDDVWKHRERLTSYSRALLALTAHRYGDSERASVLVRNLEDGATVDRAPDSSVLLKGETASETMATAHWGSVSRFWWHWYESPVETTAFVLQALVTIDPKHKLVEPAMNWLVKNRRGAQWNNTRDTAIAILSMNDYLARSGELKGDVSYELTVNGRTIATKTITAADVLGAPSRFPIDPSILSDTTQEIRIRRTSGKAPLYFSAEARFVSLEEPVKAAGNEIFVRREYFRLVARPTLLKGVLYDRIPLRDGESVVSGERIDVVVTVESKNDYDYLLFEDLKPAGFEAVALQSGQPLWARDVKSGRNTWVYQELRDRKVAMFIDHLGQGVWELSYTLRAETPGSFHALPLMGQAMYVPDIRANGDEARVVVTEK